MSEYRRPATEEELAQYKLYHIDCRDCIFYRNPIHGSYWFCIRFSRSNDDVHTHPDFCGEYRPKINSLIYKQKIEKEKKNERRKETPEDFMEVKR